MCLFCCSFVGYVFLEVISYFENARIRLKSITFMQGVSGIHKLNCAFLKFKVPKIIVVKVSFYESYNFLF